MNKLIKIELNKIFHKKSIYIIFILIFIFVILNNIIIKLNYDNEGEYITNTSNASTISSLKEKISNYNLDNDKEEYIKLKTKYDIEILKNKYSPNSWQYKKINDYLYQDIYNINYYTYYEIDNELLASKELYNKNLEYLNKDDYKYFLNQELDILKQQLEITKDKLLVNCQIDLINYRLKNNISYSSSYLNTTISNYYNNIEIKYDYDQLSNLSYKNKLDYNNNLSSLEINKYILDNKTNINKINTLNYQLRTLLEDYEIFIVILVLIISSSILSEEINKGTIKLLLTKPYSRIKILLSKYLTILIVLLIAITFLYIIELLSGSIFLGLDSIKEKVVIYNYQKSQIMCYNIFVYSLIRILSNLPKLLLLLTISFSISIITSNSIISLTLPMIIYTFAQSIDYLAINYNIRIMKYFLTTNWNFNTYLFGRLPDFKYINIILSSTLCIIYFILLIIPSFIIFKHIDIKNI